MKTEVFLAGGVRTPIGASGTHTRMTLLNALKPRGGPIGINALCIGAGKAVAMAVELC